MSASSDVPDLEASAVKAVPRKRGRSESAEDESSDSKDKYSVEQYHPDRESTPPSFLPNPNNMVILDQGEEGSAVGHGMAAMINYLLRERGIHDQVSARMLQQLSKLYGGQPLNDVNRGSVLLNGMQGWLERGVCSASLWPYRAGETGELTPERERAALKYKPERYLSVPNGVGTVQAAVCEYHAVVASGTVHQGWMFDTPAKGIIPFTGKEHIVGGHAFAIVGFTERGFIIQNSWGTRWGGVEMQGRKYPGCALWSYPDFQKNYNGGFVASLPASLSSRPRLRRAGYQSDVAEGTDLLDIRSDVEAVCAVLAARDVKPPLALGLFGNWGTGKSFFMARMYDEINALAKLERDNPGQTPYCGRVVQIRFNAWHFLDANLWASIVAEIFKNLFDAIARPDQTPQGTRRRIIRELGKARGLYRQSQMEIESAKQEEQQAQAALQHKRSEVRAQENTVQGLRDQLSTLLAGDPEVKRDLDRIAQAAGEPALAESFQALQEQTQELKTLNGSVRELWRQMFRPEGRTNRLVLLALFAGASAGIFWAAHNLPQFSGLLGPIRRWVTTLSGLLFGVAAWLAAQIGRMKSLVGRIQRITTRVEAIRAQRMDALTAPEQRELETRLQAQREAQVRVEHARQRVETLETDLQQQNPSKQLQTFIEERSGSEDYRKQLGLVSLVRRDFERLSELLATTEALEDRWYARKAEAERVNAKFDRPKRGILPMRRIVLYIDDLDRCQPDRVLEVLEAVHLLLAFPLFVVVVAVDPRWLRECLEKLYPRLLAMNGKDDQSLTATSTPQDYLEKIFQIPFYLRPISGRAYRNMIDGLTSSDLELGAPPAGEADAGGSMGSPPTPAPGSQPSSPGFLNLRRPGAASQASTSGPDEADERIKINPERLKFRQWEVNDMKRLARMFRTPRAVKRFINTYRLIRVSIPEVDIDDFIGTESVPGNYRVAQILLAIVCGYPNTASLFLQLLLRQAEAADIGTWSAFISKCAKMGTPAGGATASAKKSGAETGGHPPKTAVGKSGSVAAASQSKFKIEDRASIDFGTKWQELCDTLARLDKDFAPEDLRSYFELALRAARFSFSVSELSE
jgi:hypothetical protein